MKVNIKRACALAETGALYFQPNSFLKLLKTKDCTSALSLFSTLLIAFNVNSKDCNLVFISRQM